MVLPLGCSLWTISDLNPPRNCNNKIWKTLGWTSGCTRDCFKNERNTRVLLSTDALQVLSGRLWRCADQTSLFDWGRRRGSGANLGPLCSTWDHGHSIFSVDAQILWIDLLGSNKGWQFASLTVASFLNKQERAFTFHKYCRIKTNENCTCHLPNKDSLQCCGGVLNTAWQMC